MNHTNYVHILFLFDLKYQGILFLWKMGLFLSLLSVETKNLAPVAQEYLKKGCPPALRAKLWQQVLGSHVTKEVQITDFLPNFIIIEPIVHRLS